MTDTGIVSALEQAELAETPETLADAGPEIPAVRPTGWEEPAKLSIYFILDRGEIPAATDEGADELPMGNAPTFVKIFMDFTSEKPGEIHDILRGCVGVVVQTEDGHGKTEVTNMPVVVLSAEEEG
jgi:hypothetical protein